MSSDTKTPPRSLFDMTGELVQDKYRVEKRIASGGMGDVYLAKHEVLGKELAIKFMKPDLAEDQDTMKRFFKEAQIAASTKTDNVVDVADLGFHGSIPFIVMEYLEGPTLEEIIESQNPPSPSATARIMIQVCKTLEKIHAMGVIHRDLKPSNLMITERFGHKVVKILDFGISLLKTGKEYVRLTSTGAIMGTPFYMSPEQAQGEKDIDHRTDIYSVGAILYEMLAHRPPFEGDNYNKVIIQVATKEPENLHSINPSLVPDLVRIVRKAMSKDPAKRYESAGRMADDLNAYLRANMAVPAETDTSLPIGDVQTADRTSDRGTPSAGTIKPVAYKGTTSRSGPRRSHRWRVAVPIAIIATLLLGITVVTLALTQPWNRDGRAKKHTLSPLSTTPDRIEEDSVSTITKPAENMSALSVFTDPSGAYVEVNGKMHGQSPITIQVEKGSVHLRAAMNGYDILVDDFDIDEPLRKHYTLVAEGTEEEVAEETAPVKETRPEKKKSSKSSKVETSGKKKKKQPEKTEPEPPPKKPEPKKPKYGYEVD